MDSKFLENSELYAGAPFSEGVSSRTTETAEKFFTLRLKNEWLFKKKKHAWKDFYKILMVNGFPASLTMNQVRKKWQYTIDAYKEAKAKNYTSWVYYKIFEKYLGKSKAIDKYECWDNELRLKLIQSYINCYQNTNGKKNCDRELWRAVEIELRSSGLPLECCIQDIRGLFHHLKLTYHRKCRVIERKGSVSWPLYESMRALYASCDPDGPPAPQRRSLPAHSHGDLTHNFHWSQDLTESFIQIRLQHEWLFKERKQPWTEFSNLMVQNGYPKLCPKLIQKKWNGVYSLFQKAKASNNTNWIYYNLFQTYLEETSLNLDPLQNWQKQWVMELIHSRTRHHSSFQEYESPYLAWRKVERDLRSSEIPLDHSLLDLVELWTHLKKSFKWKSGFAAKGILSEVWPYYEAMEKYSELEQKSTAALSFTVPVEYIPDDALDPYDGFDDEDVKPLSQVSKVELVGEACRACGVRDAGVAVWGRGGGGGGVGTGGLEGGGDTIADKLSTIAGIKVEKFDGLPERICTQCLKQLEDAYQFRVKCQNTDKQHRLSLPRVKVESAVNDDTFDAYNLDFDDAKIECDADAPKGSIKKVKIESSPKRPAKRKLERPMSLPSQPKPKKKYVYTRICEICGKNVHNMREHLDAHSGVRSACEVCGKTFKYKSGLLLHRVTHNDTPVKVCQVCGKSFKHMSAYKRHYAYHADERKFTCETCGKSFNARDILKVHYLIHTEQRPYGCPECGKTFRTTGCVARHRRIVHKIKADPTAPHSFKLSDTIK